MSLAIFENSRARGRPVNLFLIRYGSQAGSYYAYTDATDPITSGGVTYSPVAVQRGAIVVKGNMDKSNFEVRMDIRLPVAELFRVYPPSQVVTLIVKQGHLGDQDNQFLTIWAGRITSARREPPELILSCESVRTMMRRVGLRRHYQLSCSHVLYGSKCKANKEAATIRATVQSKSGFRITMAPGWSTTPSRYVGGMVEWVGPNGETEISTILRVASNTLALSAVPASLQEGSEVSLIRGCARTMAACNSHNNILNFGGCPFIPTENPIRRLNQYY